MRYLLLCVPILLVITFPVDTTDSELQVAYDLVYDYPDSAFRYTEGLLEIYEKEDNLKGLVQTNFVLGYIEDEKGKYKEAILFYLKAIQHAHQNEDLVKNKLISLYKNCGVIFKKFKDFDLAEKYYANGIDLAIKSENKKQYVSLNYNLGIVSRKNKRYNQSLIHLNDAKELESSGSIKYFNILNELGLTYKAIGSLNKASYNFQKIIHELPNENAKLRGFAFHNLAQVYRLNNKLDSAKKFFNYAIVELKNLEKKEYIFESLLALGNLHISSKNYRKASKRFNQAGLHIKHITQKPEYFELYKSQADLYYALNDIEKARHYEELYYKNLMEYKETNYDIKGIIKDYENEAAKEEEIASILLWSKIISGTLLSLLILTISSNRYQKMQMKKKIKGVFDLE